VKILQDAGQDPNTSHTEQQQQHGRAVQVLEANNANKKNQVDDRRQSDVEQHTIKRHVVGGRDIANQQQRDPRDARRQGKTARPHGLLRPLDASRILVVVGHNERDRTQHHSHGNIGRDEAKQLAEPTCREILTRASIILRPHGAERGSRGDPRCRGVQGGIGQRGHKVDTVVEGRSGDESEKKAEEDKGEGTDVMDASPERDGANSDGDGQGQDL
jgi:hypothetical protein